MKLIEEKEAAGTNKTLLRNREIIIFNQTKRLQYICQSNLFIESVITFLVKDRSDKRSPSCSHAFVPGKVLELDIDRKRLNYNANLKFMPFGKSFHFYAIWEVTESSMRLATVNFC